MKSVNFFYRSCWTKGALPLKADTIIESPFIPHQYACCFLISVGVVE